MNGPDSAHAAKRSAARQILLELDVAALANRIVDPERTRVVVVVTSGNRPPSKRIDADRIAAEAGAEVEVVTLPTGSLTYALERGLPEDTHVFGDAARTYPVGTAWHTRPDLAPLRFARADTDAHRLTAQVIADARAAARHAIRPSPAPRPRAAVRTGPAPTAARPGITPAMLPGAPLRPVQTGPSSQASGAKTTGLTPATAAAITVRPASGEPPSTTQGSAATTLTPTNPRGTPRPAPTPVKATPAQATPGRTTPPHPPSAVAAVAGPSAPLEPLAGDAPWHARTAVDGQALAQHLMAAREHPVLVVTTPREDAPPLLDADDLQNRVRQVAEVVVLHNGPASWALADAMPALTQVYGGAGRVYPIDLGWLRNPYRAPIRFCWPNDDPARVADQLEDDAFAAANLTGVAFTQTTTATLPVTGKVKGFLGRHTAAVWLDRRGGDSVLLIDQLRPGVPADRLLRRGQPLAGRIEPGLMFPQFLPDPVDDDPAARIAAAYVPGDVVLAKVVELGAQHGVALLHPDVRISIVADDEADLRNLVAIDEVVTLTILTTEDAARTAELADADAPSVECPPVLPGGPPWLVEEDLSEPEPAPEPELGPEPGLASAPPPEPPPVEVVAPVETSIGTPALTPATVGQHAQLAALSAQINSLTALLDRERQDALRHEQAASRARREAQDLRRQLKSAKAQHEAYRDHVEGSALFADPEDQLRYDIEQTWLRRIPEAERRIHPLLGYRLGGDFIRSLEALAGISRDKVLDVIVEVLTDRAKDIQGRDLHPLRESESSQSQRARADGAKAWRCALQVNTPSARRLHYWRLPDGQIELDSVGTHDQGL